jgi:hypothetical protein
MSEGPAPRPFQFSLKALFVLTLVIAVLLGTVIGGLRWVAGKVIESETEWRRECLLNKDFDPKIAVEISKGWLDHDEIQSLLKKRERLFPTNSDQTESISENLISN